MLRTCQKLGFWLITIPPKMTCRLQVLDTHGFHSFKVALQHLYQRRRARCGNGAVDTSAFLQCVYAASKMVLEARSWSRAFDENGFGCGQALLSASARHELGVPLPLVGVGSPSKTDIELCFPVKANAAVNLSIALFIDGRTSATSCGRVAG